MNSNLSSSRNIILPPIGSSTLPPSSRKPAKEQRKQEIDTEFDTIVPDDKQLIVHSNNTNTPTSTVVTITEPDNASDATFPSTTNSPESLKEELAMTSFEQSRRQESSIWISDCEMTMFTLSAFFGFECAVRLPRYWLQFGGGAFLVAFATCHLVVALPLFLLEATLGQFTGHGVAGFMPQMAPALRGYPNALLFCLVVKAVSWMTNVSTVGIYIIEAVHHRPCWMNCNASFNTDRCYTHSLDQDCNARGALLFAAGRCVHRQELCQTSNSTSPLKPTLDNLSTACILLGNGSTRLNKSALFEKRVLAAAEYFNDVEHMDNDKKSMHAHGRGILSMMCCWMLVALVSLGGLEFTGFTLPLLLGIPACIAIAMMFNELVVERHFSGTWDYLVPSMEHVTDYRCWLFAATSSLLTPKIGTGFNSVIYARNPLNHDAQHSAVILIAINFLVNALWALCVAIILAKHAVGMGNNLKDMLRDYSDEPDLILLTSLLGEVGDTQVWMAFFLLCTLLLAVGSVQAAVLVIETCLRELSVLTAMSTRSSICLICSVGFGIDMVFFVFPSSHHLSVAISTYAHSYYNIVLALVMLSAVNGALGVDRLLDALSQQLAVPLRRSRWFWALCWRCLCPLALLGMFASSIWHHATTPLRFRGAPLPGWTALFGVALAAAPLLLIFVEVFRASAEDGSDDEALYRPTERWRAGLLSAEEYAAAVGSVGRRDSGPGAAKSLMFRMYGVVSSRRLFARGSLARLESRIVPIVSVPRIVETRPVPTDGALRGLETRCPPTDVGPSGLETRPVPAGARYAARHPGAREPGGLDTKHVLIDGSPGGRVPDTAPIVNDNRAVDTSTSVKDA